MVIMSPIINSLAAFCRRDALNSKLVLAPSLRVGRQWLETLARHGHPLMNTQAGTVKALGLDLAGPTLLRRKLDVLPERGAAVVCGRILERLRPRGRGYIFSLPPGESLNQGLALTIRDLRLAGLAPADLPSAAFEDRRKGMDIKLLLEAWEREMADRNLADYAMVLQLARAALGETQFPYAAVFIPADMRLSAAEEELLAAIPPEVVHREEPLSGASNPRRSLYFFRSVGEINEVRETLRRTLALGIPWDTVELLYSDGDTYLPLIYETFCRLAPEASRDEETFPATFADGIPTRYFRPGRALAGWLQWLNSGRRQSVLARLIGDGLLNAEEADESNGGMAQLADILRSLPIGLGRDRYLPAVDKALEACAAETGAANETAPSDPETAERRQNLSRLRRLLEKLLACDPGDGAEPRPLLEAAAYFVAQAARSVSRLDNYARERLGNEIRDMRRWLADGAGPPLAFRASDWLASLPVRVCVGGSGPRPGKIHVAHLQAGGHSGRNTTFVVGLDESRFPGAGYADPFLLDRERMRLSSRLITASERLDIKTAAFRNLVGRLEGSVTLSYCCRDLTDDRELFPSPLLLEAYGGGVDLPEAGLERFTASIPVVSFAPDDETKCLDDSEWWLWRLSAEGSDPQDSTAVFEAFPHLARGRHAADMRRSTRFTEYDGLVAPAGPAVDPAALGAVVSASRLETLARCPLNYFFRYVLGLAPAADEEPPMGRWLDAKDVGFLIHGIYDDLMSELASGGRTPELARDLPRAVQIAEEHLLRYRRRRPPPSEAFFEMQRDYVLRSVRIFLAVEEEFCRRFRPVYIEAFVGEDSAARSSFDSPDPIAFPLPGGRSVLLRGKLDRIDRGTSDGNGYVITDYKTGVSNHFRGGDSFRQGRVLQHAVYSFLAEARLRQIGQTEAKVTAFRYLFTSPREKGFSVIRTRADAAGLDVIVNNLLELAARGAFPASECSDDCRLCDYKAICGDRSETDPISLSLRGKLEDENNEILAPWRALRCKS